MIGELYPGEFEAMEHNGRMDALEQEPCEEELDFVQEHKKISCNLIVEPCEDCISRQAVLESIKNLYPDMPVVDIMGSRRKWLDKYAPYFECENAIERSPSVNPQTKTGHWITKPHIYGVAFCSECDFELRIDDTKYCPNCGAKMVEPQETETWNGYHGQITAPKGTFERIFNDADDDNDI